MAMHGKIFFVGGRGCVLAGDGGFRPESQDAWQPAADILELEGGFLVQVDLPGVDAASMEALIEGNSILIRGVRRIACPDLSKRYVHMEISRGSFSKLINLPAPVSADEATAVLRDGVLEIRLPRGRVSGFLMDRLRIRAMS
jgi:HSP20 family protein